MLQQLDNYQVWIDNARQLYSTRDYSNAVGFYEVILADKEAQYGNTVWPKYWLKVSDCPFYYCALLAVDQMQDTNSSNPSLNAILKFHGNLDEMTNTMHFSIAAKLIHNAYNSSQSLKQNAANLRIVKLIVPIDQQKYLQTIIDSVDVMSTNTTNP